MMRKLATTISTTFALLLVLGLAGCNTMGGMGEDMEDAGDAMEDEAIEEEPLDDEPVEDDTL